MAVSKGKLLLDSYLSYNIKIATGQDKNVQETVHDLLEGQKSQLEFFFCSTEN